MGVISFVRRIFTPRVLLALTAVVAAVAGVLSIPLLQPYLVPEPKVDKSRPRDGAPPAKAERSSAVEQWVFVGTSDHPHQGRHSDFIEVSSIRNIGDNSYRLRIANTYQTPQYHSTTLAKAQAVVNCNAMTIRFEEISAYYRNGGFDGTVSTQPDEHPGEPASPGNFGENVARYVCRGPGPGDVRVSEEEFYRFL